VYSLYFIVLFIYCCYIKDVSHEALLKAKAQAEEAISLGKVLRFAANRVQTQTNTLTRITTKLAKPSSSPKQSPKQTPKQSASTSPNLSASSGAAPVCYSFAKKNKKKIMKLRLIYLYFLGYFQMAG
jgi:hypothetical protein